MKQMCVFANIYVLHWWRAMFASIKQLAQKCAKSTTVENKYELKKRITSTVVVWFKTDFFSTATR